MHSDSPPSSFPAPPADGVEVVSAYLTQRTVSGAPSPRNAEDRLDGSDWSACLVCPALSVYTLSPNLTVELADGADAGAEWFNRLGHTCWRYLILDGDEAVAWADVKRTAGQATTVVQLSTGLGAAGAMASIHEAETFSKSQSINAIDLALIEAPASSAGAVWLRRRSDESHAETGHWLFPFGSGLAADARHQPTAPLAFFQELAAKVEKRVADESALNVHYNEQRRLWASLADGDSKIGHLLEAWRQREDNPTLATIWRGSPEPARMLSERLLDEGLPLDALQVSEQGRDWFEDDPPLIRSYSLAMARLGDYRAAREELVDLMKSDRSLETLGMLARTYKDEAFQDEDSPDVILCLEASKRYEATLVGPNDYWPGINVAFMSLLGGDEAKARSWASRVQAVCESLDPSSDQDEYWRLATIAESILIQSQGHEAERLRAAATFQEAAKFAGKNRGMIDTTRLQAKRILWHFIVNEMKPVSSSDWRTARRVLREQLDQLVESNLVLVFGDHRLVLDPSLVKSRFSTDADVAARAAVLRDAIRDTEDRLTDAYVCVETPYDILMAEILQDKDKSPVVGLPALREDVNRLLNFDDHWSTRLDQVMKRAKGRIEFPAVGRARQTATAFLCEALYGLAIQTAESPVRDVRLTRIRETGGPPVAGDLSTPAARMFHAEGLEPIEVEIGVDPLAA